VDDSTIEIATDTLRVKDGGITATKVAADVATQAELDAHISDASAAHAASAVSVSSTTLSGTGTDAQAVFEEIDNLLDDHSARHEDGGADEIDLTGLSGTPAALTAHEADTTSVHGIADTAALYRSGGTDVAVADGGTGASTAAGARTALDVPSNAEAILDALVDAKGDLIVGTAADTPARLAVGTNDHVLTADSAQAAGVKWAAAPGGGVAWPRKYKTGLWYQTDQGPPADSSLTLTLDRVVYHAFPVGEALTIDRISCGIATAGSAGSVVRLGIYGDTDGEPGTLLLDAGTVAGDSTGYKDITISQALSAGTLYWIAVVWQVAAVGTVRASGIGSGSEWIGQLANNTDPRTCAFVQTGVTGALPGTATPTLTGAPSQHPAVKIRVA
jgi:hypothetical protein